MAAAASFNIEAQSEIFLVVKTLTDSWNTHDMSTYAAQFTDDADFINVLGMHSRGRAEIESLHVTIHRTIFRNSTLKTLSCSLRPLAPGIALAHINWEMTGHEILPGAPFGKVRHGVVTGVFVEQDGKWRIRAFHNTDTVPVALAQATT